MKIKSAAIRCFLLDLRCFADVLLQFIVIITAFTLIWGLSDTVAPSYMILLFGAVIPMTMTMQRYTTYFTQFVGFGITRSSFVFGGLLIKPVYMLFTGLTLLISQLIGGTGMSTSGICIVGVVLALIGTSMGDIMGSLMLKFGKLGMVIYIVFYMLICGGCGVFGGLLVVSGNELPIFGVGPLLILAGASLILVAVGSMTAWLLVRRIEVR